MQQPPDADWLTRLRCGHFVWLVKEQRFGNIEWAYEPPTAGAFCGRVNLRPVSKDADGWRSGPAQTWYIQQDGCGIDGAPLLLPVEGNCPDEPSAMSEPWVRYVEQRLQALAERVRRLEAR